MNNLIRSSVLILMMVISGAMHLEHISKDLISIHVWRQTQTQSTIINFYEEDMNILNPRRNERGNTEGFFRMEFPIMQWGVAILYKIFGNHLIISRLFMFVIGLFSVFGIYRLIFALFKIESMALLGAWALTFSPSFFYYTINPLPDNLSLCCAIWGLALFFEWVNSNKNHQLLGTGILLSVAALSKLPFIVFYIVPGVYFIKLALKEGVSTRLIFSFVMVAGFSVLPVAWYYTVIPTWHGNPIVLGMFDNQESILKLLDYLQHNLISTLPELLLNYGSVLFFIAGFVFLIKRKAFKDSRFLALVALSTLVLLYYLFEANAIAKIHDYYLFPFFPLLFILVAYGGYYLLKSSNKFFRYLSWLLIVTLPVTCYLRMEVRWDESSPGFNVDLLTHKEELQNVVPKDALVVAGNDESRFIFFYYIDKKGWGFSHDELTATQLQTMINKGAEYLYIDSKTILENKELQTLLGQKLGVYGSIEVYSLIKS